MCTTQPPPPGEPPGDEPVLVSVLIPAYNEEAVIAETVAEAAEVLARMPGHHEILVCDDGSADRTWAILAELSGRYPMLRAIRHKHNQGYPAATRTLAEAARGRYVAQYAADREWSMSEIPRMLAEIEKGCDIVIGVRRSKDYSLWRKFVSGCFNWLVALLWGKHFGDIGSIKMARARLWSQIPFRSASAFGQAERLIIAHHNGARIRKILVGHVARDTGKSKYASPTQALRAFLDVVRFRFSARSRTRIPDDWRTE